MKININDKVSVRLTPHGHEVLHSYCHTSNTPVSLLKFIVMDSNDEYVFQLWELMGIFGPEMYMGNKQVFKKNEIILESRK